MSKRIESRPVAAAAALTLFAVSTALAGCVGGSGSGTSGSGGNNGGDGGGAGGAGVVAPPTCIDGDGDRYGDGPGCRDFDCDDTDPAINPGAVEACDFVDNDCDGAIDDGCPCQPGDQVPCGKDVGACTAGQQTCVNATLSPCLNSTGASAELCDGLDNDCDGLTDEAVTNACGACGEAPAEICNGADDDCDGQTDEGVLNACGQCGAVPTELCNGQDDDCDGETDEDFGLLGESCDGDDPDECAAGTLACRADGSGIECAGDVVRAEVCDGADNDCDGEIDEDFAGLGAACDGPDPDTCPSGRQVCNAAGDGLVCEGDEQGVERCNGVDDDCDGLTDELLDRVTVDLDRPQSILAADLRGVEVTLVAAYDGLANLWIGPPSGPLQSRGAIDASDGRAYAAAIADGTVAVVTGGTAGLTLSWGQPGALQSVDLPMAALELTEVASIHGVRVGLSGSQPLVIVTAGGKQGERSTTTRVAFVPDGGRVLNARLITVQPQFDSLPPPSIGGHTGGVVGLPGGRFIAVMQTAGQGCEWYFGDAEGFRTSDHLRECDELLGAPVLVEETLWQYAPDDRGFGGADHILVRAPYDGTPASSRAPLAGILGTGWLAGDDLGRLRFLGRNDLDGALHHTYVSGGAGSEVKMQTDVTGTDIAHAFGVGDELRLLLVTRGPDRGDPLTRVELAREVVCHGEP